jgi:hypothetical protein
MAGRGSDDRNGSVRELAEELVVAVLGAAEAGVRRFEGALGGGSGDRVRFRPDDLGDAVREVAARWRGETMRVSERASSTLSSVFRELGLVTRDEVEELELRLAQLEHRLRLLERSEPPDRSVQTDVRAKPGHPGGGTASGA